MHSTDHIHTRALALKWWTLTYNMRHIVKRPHAHSQFLYTHIPVKSWTPKKKKQLNLALLSYAHTSLVCIIIFFCSNPAKCKSFHTCTCLLHHHQDPPNLSKFSPSSLAWRPLVAGPQTDEELPISWLQTKQIIQQQSKYAKIYFRATLSSSQFPNLQPILNGLRSDECLIQKTRSDAHEEAAIYHHSIADRSFSSAIGGQREDQKTWFSLVYFRTSS